MNIQIFLAIIILSVSLITSFGEAKSGKHPETVEYVDLGRYAGKWFEIARLPNRFQKNCTATQADYTLREDGNIQVVNTCRLKSLDGKLKTAKGKAKVADPKSNSKLRVTFFWPFYGDYWILHLGPDYEYALVGTGNRKYLWILSRTRELNPEIYDSLVQKANEQGFDTSRLEKTLQPAPEHTPIIQAD